MASAYRRKGRTCCTVKFRVNGIEDTVRGYPDKASSEALGQNIERLAAKRAMNEQVPKNLIDWLDGLEQRLRLKLVEVGLLDGAATVATKTSFTDHVTDYISDLEGQDRDEMYCYNLRHRLDKIGKECGWTRLDHIKAEDFVSWRARNKALSQRTRNQYLETLKGFLAWAIRMKRIHENPLAVVGKGDETVKARKRRALTAEELDRVLDKCGDRALCYKTTVYCQLRRADVEALCWDDVHLDLLNPYLLTRAETSKGKRETQHPLRVDLAEALKARRPADAKASDRVFPYVPTRKMWKADLKRAEIEYKDAMGRQADFHSLGRQTPNTMMANAGVAPRIAQGLMRHTDIRLTMGPYVDEGLLQKRAAVEMLPVIGEGLNVAPAVLQMTGTDDKEYAEVDKWHHKRHQSVGNKGARSASIGTETDSSVPIPADDESDVNPCKNNDLASIGTEGSGSATQEVDRGKNWGARTRT